MSRTSSRTCHQTPRRREAGIDIVDERDCWLVQVRDFGKGIPDRDKPLIFTRFTRLKKEGVEGSGLGLAIVKRLVDLHKGSIWVEDNPAGGSIFCVRLPKRGPQAGGCATDGQKL
jgi:signal transduction histidine kinase